MSAGVEGALNENLPKFVVLGGPTRSVTRESIDALCPGPQYSGIPLELDPKNPLPFAQRNAGQTLEQQQHEYEAINQLNELTAVEYPDHHPIGFTVWLAGAGLKKGHVHGETDELGYNALGDGHYVTDLHATVLHLLGLDNRRLEIPGRKRLEIDHGKVIEDIVA